MLHAGANDVFEVVSEDANGQGRLGRLKTVHGTFDTPFFMPVATKGSVKTLTSDEVAATGSKVLIANAFLLSLEPGSDIIKNAGGLHSFMRWSGGIFTDSGGFQIIRKRFSPAVQKDGVLFKSPYDGGSKLLTPEDVVRIQKDLAPDIAMLLDDCPPWGTDMTGLNGSVQRTLDWARRAKAEYMDWGGLVFGITQGGIDADLRRHCSEELAKMEFSGYGIGGLAIGEPEADMFRVLEVSNTSLPRGRPRYLMGVGSPTQLFECVDRGVDMFDSVVPTRNARHNTLLTFRGKVNIRRSNFAGVQAPLEEGCDCITCKTFTKAYVFHLLHVKEMLGQRLVTIHNVRFIQRLMEGIRLSLREGAFQQYKADFLKGYGR